MSFAFGVWMIFLSLWNIPLNNFTFLIAEKSHAMSICMFFHQVWHPCTNLVVQLNYITWFSVFNMCQQFIFSHGDSKVLSDDLSWGCFSQIFLYFTLYLSLVRHVLSYKISSPHCLIYFSPLSLPSLIVQPAAKEFVNVCFHIHSKWCHRCLGWHMWWKNVNV